MQEQNRLFQLKLGFSCDLVNDLFIQKTNFGINSCSDNLGKSLWQRRLENVNRLNLNLLDLPYSSETGKKI